MRILVYPDEGEMEIRLLLQSTFPSPMRILVYPDGKILGRSREYLVGFHPL